MNDVWPFIEWQLVHRVSTAGYAPLSSRLPRWVGAPADAETVLRKLRVGIIGTGSVGMSVADHVARLHVGEIWLVDPRRCCKPECLLTHPIHRASGQPKAAIAARRCKQISPASMVFFFAGKVQDLPLDAMAHVGIWFMATDNLTAEVEVGQRCIRLGKPLIHAALHGETMTIQIRVLGNKDAAGPCPACLFGADERRLLSTEVQYSCEGGASASAGSGISGPPTRSASCLCSLAADLAVLQLLRVVLKLGEPVENTILEYCAYTHGTVTGKLKGDPDCRCDHTRFKLATGRMPLEQYSLCTLASDFGLEANDPLLTLTVGGANWVEQAACRCVESSLSGHFVPHDGRKHRCPQCQSPIELLPFHTHRAVTFPRLGKAAATSLAGLGASRIPWVLLRDSKQAILVQDPSRAQPISQIP